MLKDGDFLTLEQLQRLQNLKEKSNITNKAIAEKVGTTESTVSRILSGESKDPSFDILTKMIYVLGGTVEDILNGIKTTGGTAEVDIINSIKQIYEVQVANERKDKTYLAALCAVLILFIVGLFTYDILHRGIGWIQY